MRLFGVPPRTPNLTPAEATTQAANFVTAYLPGEASKVNVLHGLHDEASRTLAAAVVNKLGNMSMASPREALDHAPDPSEVSLAKQERMLNGFAKQEEAGIAKADHVTVMIGSSATLATVESIMKGGDGFKDEHGEPFDPHAPANSFSATHPREMRFMSNDIREEISERVMARSLVESAYTAQPDTADVLFMPPIVLEPVAEYEAADEAIAS